MNQETTRGKSRLRAHLRALVGERHPVSSPANLRRTELYLTEEFSRLGLEIDRNSFEALGGTYCNVIGTVGGRRRTPPLILAAHYDTVVGSPGADDNASGLAVLLEVARRVATAPFRRPVRFIAFNLEEENLLGSRAYTAQLITAQQPVYGAMVLECVGCARNDEGSQQIPPNLPVVVPSIGDFLAVIGNQASASFTAEVAQAMRPYLPIVPLVVPGNGELLPDTRRSDHAAFWERGMPAVMLTDTANFRNPHYHQPTDTLEALDLDFLRSVSDAVTAAILALATSSESS